MYFHFHLSFIVNPLALQEKMFMITEIGKGLITERNPRETQRDMEKENIAIHH